MEKLPIHTAETREVDDSATTRSPPRQAVFLRRLIIGLCLIVGYYIVSRAPANTLRVFAPCRHHKSPEAVSFEGGYGFDLAHDLGMSPESARHSTGASDDSKKVPFEAHIMSKCPDAQACLRQLVIPTMEQVYDKVDFQLSFIANVSKESHEIECMHGPGECIGNMLMLCAANLPFPPTSDQSLLPQSYPRTPIVRSLGFANCLTTDYQRIPDRNFVQNCALEHGIDFEALNTCASQQDDNTGGGLALLRQSALRGEELGVKTSCTIRVNETVWCVHDNNQWKDCAKNGDNPKVLAEEIRRLWKENNDGR
ncbi:hypothetical protein N7468_001379 [Penicillium chermesinum]|uniref:Gamma interferon inducible lysosomal thiol reductase GILT n=1 Tax=Penicillium chermesinum TaxID=63820 RepID=A0A9W9TWI1_9EURO|nr:uncharacterized protein N7468_001379 [Penicillium chermesinum]KAJ5246396.1 hypothetical protein N7468_001379 [Penicillium chermesinum]